MNFMTKIIAFVIAFTSLTALARPVRKQRVLHMEGVITKGTIAPLQTALDEWIASGDTSPVTLIIDSPGGEVFAGIKFVTSMLSARSQGIRINCYVTGIAASMAFQTLTQCSERHALKTAFLLWHGVRLRTDEPITARLATSLADDMRRLDALIMYQLSNSLTLSEADIIQHFDAETLWSGFTLHEEVPAFMKVDEAFADINDWKKVAVKSAEFSPFGFGGEVDSFMLTHIWRKYEPLLMGR